MTRMRGRQSRYNCPLHGTNCIAIHEADDRQLRRVDEKRAAAREIEDESRAADAAEA